MLCPFGWMRLIMVKRIMTMVMDIPFIANNFPVFINGSGIPPHPHCHLPHSLVLLVREIGFACYHRVLRVLLRFFSHSKSFSFDVAMYEPYLICNLVRSRFSVFFFNFLYIFLLYCCCCWSVSYLPPVSAFPQHFSVLGLICLVTLCWRSQQTPHGLA